MFILILFYKYDGVTATLQIQYLGILLGEGYNWHLYACRLSYGQEIPTPVPPKHKKWCVDILHPGCTGTHYLTHTSHRMQKHMFTVMCPDALFVESIPVPTEHEK
jgi:hypothetical protein